MSNNKFFKRRICISTNNIIKGWLMKNLKNKNIDLERFMFNEKDMVEPKMLLGALEDELYSAFIYDDNVDISTKLADILLLCQENPDYLDEIESVIKNYVDNNIIKEEWEID